MKYIKTCPICNSQYSTYREFQKTCSKSCMGINQTGPNNPNYGNTWSDAQKEHLSRYQKSISNIISERVKQDWKDNDTRKENAACVMSTTMKALYSTNPEIFVRKHSEETKALIGVKSKAKFTEEFLKKQRSTMETLGFWRSLEEMTAYELYFNEANWVARMWDIVPNEKLYAHGILNTKTNTNGCVRDHMFGRREGFKLGVPPIILRHPANCELILNSDNIKKAKTNDVSKSLETLISDIKAYTLPWFEQEDCLRAIANYLNTKGVIS